MYRLSCRTQRKIPGGLGIKNISKRHFEQRLNPGYSHFAKNIKKIPSLKKRNTLKKFIYLSEVTELQNQCTN